MEYDNYKEKIRNFLKRLTLLQRASAIFVLLIIIGVAIFFINPAKKLAESRNSQRRADIALILNAVYEYSVANSGEIPSVITENPTMICAEKASSCNGFVDLSILKEGKKYISQIPTDPTEKSANNSGYLISKSASGRLRATAPNAELGATIILSK